jgi:hypothetical protein
MCFHKVAWAVGLQVPTYQYNPLNPFPFTIVNINQGGLWNASAYAAVIKQAGIYYVHIHMHARDNKTAQVWVNVNGQRQFAAEFLSLQTACSYNSQQRSRSVTGNRRCGDC